MAEAVRRYVYRGIIAFGIFLRFRRLALRPFWIDELEQLHALSMSFKQMLFAYLPKIPGGFPGDYLITWPLAQLSNDKWILAIPHMFTLGISFWLFDQILKVEDLTPYSQIIAMAVFSLNPSLIFHALEFRPYAVLPVLSMAYYLLLLRISKAGTLSKPAAAYLAVLTFVTLVFHSYGLLIVGILIIYHLFLRQDRTIAMQIWKRLIPTMVGAGILAFPVWLYYSLANAGKHMGVNTFEYSHRTILGMTAFIFGNLGDLGWHRSWLISLGIVIASILVSRSGRLRNLIFLGWVILLPIGLILFLDLRAQYWFIQRQFVWVMPFWALLTAHAADELLELKI